MTEFQDRLQVVVGDTYRIIDELGGGGMSRVFLAEEVGLHRKVVIKVLPQDMTGSVNIERFQREIQLAASLQHPHIVQLLTAGAEGDLLYYVMPYIEGESLRGKLARGKVACRRNSPEKATRCRHGIVLIALPPTPYQVSDFMVPMVS